MLNRDIYAQDPREFHLLNNGVAKVRDAMSEEEIKTLRFELQTFICEGQYEEGLVRLLKSYLGNLDQPEQPAAWISGFFGSGKSHLVKMLRYLWVNYTFPDGATARSIANLSTPVQDLLRELSTQGQRLGGLRAVSGTLGSHKKGSVRLALLSLVFKSAGLPEHYPLAQFVLWLQREGLYDALRSHVEGAGRDWDREIRNLTKSKYVASGLLELEPTLGGSVADVRQLLKSEHPHVDDVSVDDMVQAIHDALAPDGPFPCTLIALDEIQQYIGDDSQKTYDVQEVTQACVSAFEGKLLFVATGQTALTGTPELAKLTGRYRIQVQLSDADVEKVTRKTVLKKKPSARPEVEGVLTRNSGEISRHLTDTEFAPKPEDERHLVDDYPLLPTRRRFWERVLRAVDEAGTQSQLRTQLKIVDEAVKQTADEALGTVVAGDFIYDDLRSDMLRSGVLSNDIDTRIEKLREEDGDALGARLCALAFLIGKLPREEGADTGLRATPEVFADLLVRDLGQGSSTLRSTVEARLDALVDRGLLMDVEGEYRLQTQESQEWTNDFRARYREIISQRERIASLRGDALRQAAGEALDDVKKLKHGKCKERRSIEVSFSREQPAPSGEAIPVWVRNGWRDTEASVEADARQAGTDSALITVFLPKRSADQLDEAIATEKAAHTTIQVRGRTSTQEGMEARQAMQTRRDAAHQKKEDALDEILGGARVYLAGGQEYVADNVAEAVREAATHALERLYPKFDVADDNRWHKVLKRALDGDVTALEALDYRGNVEDHDVCAEVLKAVSTSKKGTTVRKQFTSAPHGWPQDAIDASLALLTLTKHVQARSDGQSVDATDLTQRTIGTAQFRAETVTLKHRQILEVRHLLSQFVKVEPSEERAAVPLFLDHVKDLADSFSGPPPYPERPDTSYLGEIARAAGNEQLAKLHAHKERILRETGEWQSMRNRTSKREEEWSQLQRALRHAEGLSGVDAIAEQAEAIETNRMLLDPSDPVQPLLSQATDLLRAALREVHGAYTSAYDDHRAELEGAATWQELPADQQDALLARHDLSAVPPIEVESVADVLRSLDRISLSGWQARLDALPKRFGDVLAEAARALEPDTVRVRLPSRVLKTTGDVEAWLGEVRERLMQQVEDGPVQV